MILKQFIASLLPSFERNRITEDVDLLRSELKDNVLPAYKSATALTKGRPFKTKLLQDFNGVFILNLPQYRRVGFIEGTYSILASMPAKLDMLEGMVMELFAKDVTKDTITYRKASILQYLETVRFVNKYAARSLLRFAAAETQSLHGSEDNLDQNLTAAELQWLTGNQSAYIAALKVLALPEKDLSATLKEIPDIAVVPERMEVVKHTVGDKKLDPLRLGFIAADKNPIYHLRMAYAEWQVKRYQENVEEKRVLELRILALKEAYAGKKDARLAHQIEYTEGRLQKLRYATQQMEERYAHT